MATTCKLIAKNVLGSDTSNVEFTSIPATYTDLLLCLSGRSDRSGQVEDSLKWQFNSDTGSNYSYKVLYGNGSTTYSDGQSSVAYDSIWGVLPAATATASTFGNVSIYIPNYAGNTNKSSSAEGCGESNTATGPLICASAAIWSSTAAITSVKLFPYHGSNFKSGSSFFLYGITKA